MKTPEVRLAELKIELADYAARDVLTPAENDEVSVLLAEWDGCTREIRLAEVRAAHNDPNTRVENANDGLGDTPAFQVGRNRVGDPWKNEAASLRDRAMAAAEQVRLADIVNHDGARHQLTDLIEREGEVHPLAAQWLLATGDEHYRTAFEKW